MSRFLQQFAHSPAFLAFLELYSRCCGTLGYTAREREEFLLGTLLQAGLKAARLTAQWGGQDLQELSSPVACYIPAALSAFQSCEGASRIQHPVSTSSVAQFPQVRCLKP